MTRFLLVVCSAAALAGCATAAVRADYADPREIEILNDQFSPTDLQMIADRMAGSIVASPYFKSLPKPPRVVVARIANNTPEAIDMDSLADSIQIAMFKQGGFEVVDPRVRLEIAKEYEYQQSGYVEPGQAKGPGHQIAADFIVTGTLSSIAQQGAEESVVHYKMSMLASELSTGVVRWAEDQQIRKRFVMTGISVSTSHKLRIAGYSAAGTAFLVGTGLLIAGLAPGLGTYVCGDNICSNPVDAGLAWTGAGLMIAGPILAILTAVLVPNGNPGIVTVSLTPDGHGLGFGLVGRF